MNIRKWTWAILAIFAFAIVMLTACGSSGSDDDDNDLKEIPVNQTLEFGEYKIEVDTVSLSDKTDNLFINLKVYNGSASEMSVNEIMGFYAYQGDYVINNADFNDENKATLETIIPSMEYFECLLDCDLQDMTTPVDLTFFPDDATGLNQEGATELDITVNPADATVTTAFNTY